MRNREIRLTDLFSVLLKRIWFIVAALIVGAAIAFYYSQCLVTPRYQSVSKYLVDTTNLSGEVSTTSASIEEQRNTVLSRLVVSSYIEILETRNFAEYIAELLADNPELSRPYSGAEVNASMAFQYQEELESYTVTITATNAQDALIIAECIQNESERYLITKKPSAEGTLKVIDNARLGAAPINVNVPLSVLLGAFVGALIAFCIAFLIDISDVRVKDEKEISEILELPVIGSIPDCTGSAAHERSGKR
ncbi:MAG: YveK family protein [Eubacteriales bacterium]